MFQSIDRNHNGEIDKAELRTAFSQSGVTVSNARLDEFFAEVDKNNDGVITYAEWRYESHRSRSSETRSRKLKLT
jgi:Ca2+-binding protein (EF-Hand superfamily)